MLPLAGVMAACGGASGGGSNLTPADNVFDGANAYYTAGTEEKISAKMTIEGTISEVSCGRATAENSQYGYNDGILTLDGTFIKSITGTGEKTIKIKTDKGTSTLSVLACTEVITTADEFQALNTDATTLSGTYILGNDIDLSSISNFEPLGWYVTEEDPTNAYFHGILEGNGHTIKNAKVYWSDNVATNYGPYSGSSGVGFKHEGHTAGDNIGLFQVIGSSGIVRNVNFSNIDVRGRTIVGVIAGNCMGTVENCYVDSQCSVEMGTHFYDDDCNMGGAFGIVAGTGNVSNVISEVTSLTLGATGGGTFGGQTVEKAGIYLDFDDKYKTETGNGWDHGVEPNTNNWWKFCGVDKADTSGVNYKDSNNALTNGEYAFVGKCWGAVSNCVSKAFQITPMDGTARDIYFGQTHVGNNKPASGETDLGSLTDDQILSADDMKVASNYSAFDSNIWSIADGAVPSLKAQYSFYVAPVAE